MTVLLASYVSRDTQFDIEFVKLCVRIVPYLLFTRIILHALILRTNEVARDRACVRK